MYKCIKGFLIELCDDNGFIIENEYMNINKDTIWYISKDEDYRLIDGEVRLENEEMDWIEATKETFKNNFELIQYREGILTNKLK